jgi:hypothetical protein
VASPFVELVVVEVETTSAVGRADSAADGAVAALLEVETAAKLVVVLEGVAEIATHLHDHTETAVAASL